MAQGATVQKLACGGRVCYYTLDLCNSPNSPGSPTSILHHSASLLSVCASASDSEPEAA